MTQLNTHPLGSAVRVTIEFRDPENGDALYDPDAVSVVVTDPHGGQEVFVSGIDSEIEHEVEDVGIYPCLFPCAIPGAWEARANGDDVAFQKHEWLIDTARGVVLAGIYAKDPPASRTLVVGSRRDDDEADISAPITMKPGEKYTWRISFARTQLASRDLVDGMSAPVVGGDEAANCTVHATEGTGWGLDPSDLMSVLVEPSISGSATSDDEIYIDLTVAPETGDVFKIRIPVEVDG